MIIDYDTRPDASIDEKLRSLIRNIQLALDEIESKEKGSNSSQGIDVDTITVLIRELSDEVRSYSDAITGINGRVEALEETTIPGIDGRVTTLEDTTIPAIQDDISTLSYNYTDLDGRVTTIEGQQPLPAAPVVDGAYQLTVTVTDGVPIYTWEAV